MGSIEREYLIPRFSIYFHLNDFGLYELINNYTFENTARVCVQNMEAKKPLEADLFKFLMGMPNAASTVCAIRSVPVIFLITLRIKLPPLRGPTSIKKMFRFESIITSIFRAPIFIPNKVTNLCTSSIILIWAFSER